MSRNRRASNNLPFIIGLFAGLLLIWWLLRRPAKRDGLVTKFEPGGQGAMTRATRSFFKEADTVEVPAPVIKATPSQAETALPARSRLALPDDLTPIDGIGPKINTVLHAAGITTLSQLARTEVSRLEQILSQAGLRLAKPDTWPEQAKLAAADDWEGLKQLQGQLKGGRRRL